jgi:ferric-dicitrate binding protein FerR (iron transport regulator)
MTPELREMVDRRKNNTLTTEDTWRLLDASIARETARKERQRRAGIYEQLAIACAFAARSTTMRAWEHWEAQIQTMIGELNGQP